MIRKLASPAWSILEYGWYPLLGFLTTPYFLHALGTNRFAHWILLSATVGFGGILNAGTGAATIKHVSAARGAGDSAAVENTVGSALAVALVLGTAVSLVVFLVFWFAGDELFENMGGGRLIKLTGLVAAIMICFEQLENVFSSALKGAELFGVAARLEVISKTVQSLSALLVFHLTGSFSALFATLAIVSFGRVILKGWSASRLLQLSSLRPSFSNLGSVLHFAKWGWLQGVAGMLFGIVDRLLVGSLLGSASLAHYALVTQLAQQIHAVPAAGISVIFPKLSRQLEVDGEFSLSRLTKVTLLISVASSSTFALGLALFGDRILVLWLGHEQASAVGAILLPLTLAYWLLSLMIVPYFVLLALGNIRFVGIASFAAGVAAVAGLYAASVTWGPAGIPAGRVIYAVGTFALLVPFIHQLRNRRRSRMPLEPLP